MSRTGAGTYVLPAGNPVVIGTTIDPSAFNTTMTDIAAALTQSIAADGETPLTNNLPFGNYKATGLAAGTATTDAANVGQVQSGVNSYLSIVTGSDTITATSSPAPSAYVAGMRFVFIAAGTNATTSVTLNVSGLGAKNVTKNGAVALLVGDIPSGEVVEVFYDGTQFQITNTPSAAFAKLSGATFTGTVVAPLFSGPATQLNSTASAQMPNISATMASSAMTISLAPMYLDFRNSALNAGTPSTILCAPANLVIPATATLGSTSAVLARQYILLLNNAGVSELVIIGSVPPGENTLISTTGIAAASNSATTIYSTTARTSLPFRVIGYVESTQAIAGTWVTAVSQIQSLVVAPQNTFIRRTTYKIAGTFTWTKGMGTRSINVKIVGSGGGGYTTTPTPGGGGGYTELFMDASALTTVSVTLGAVGAGTTFGTSAGTSSFGAFCSVSGSNGGANTTTMAGSTGVGGDINSTGGGTINGAGAFAAAQGSTSTNTTATPGLGVGGNLSTTGSGGLGIIIVEEYA